MTNENPIPEVWISNKPQIFLVIVKVQTACVTYTTDKATV